MTLHCPKQKPSQHEGSPGGMGPSDCSRFWRLLCRRLLTSNAPKLLMYESFLHAESGRLMYESFLHAKSGILLFFMIFVCLTSVTMKSRFHQMGVSKNNGTPKSSILIGVSIINHPFWGKNPPIFGNIQISPWRWSKIMSPNSCTSPRVLQCPNASMLCHRNSNLWSPKSSVMSNDTHVVWNYFKYT